MSLDTEVQSTSVDSPSPAVNPGESTPGDASLVIGGDQAPERSGDVTAQPDVETATATTEGTEAPTETADPLEGVPALDELERQAEQKVPYAQALLKLRTALEARNGEVGELKSLEPFKDITTLGEPEVIKSKVETHDLLFTPVVNQATQQQEFDEQGLPRITTAPFIERVDSENPGLAEQMLNDLLTYAPERADGQRVPLWKELLATWGLDPNRLKDYQNIDALTPQITGTVTPEELADIPEEFHETFKSLPPGVRNDLSLQDEETRKFNLEVYKERADRKAREAQYAEQTKAQQQQQVEEARQAVTREQDSYVEQQLKESYAAIMDDLASQVTFSGDETNNAVMLDAVGAYLLALRDPAQSFAVERSLARLGVKVDPTFHEAVASADKHLRDAKAYEMFGQKGLAQNSRNQAANAKKLAMAKSSVIAVKVAKALGAQASAKAARQGQSLSDATSTRPVPGNGASPSETSGLLPPGMRADDPRAGVYLARRTGLLGG